MFSHLKNKIKEETGSDINLITSIKSHKRTGSAASLNSFTIDSGPEDSSSPNPNIRFPDGQAITTKEFKKLESKEDEWRKKLQKKDDEWGLKLKKIEDTFRKKMDEKEEKFQMLSQKCEKQTNELAQVQNLAAEYKRKMCEYREELDQLEGFQTQEMGKMKHLLLVKEQSITELKAHINELQSELKSLRAAEAQLQLAQDTTENVRRECAIFRGQLAAQDAELRTLRAQLEISEARKQQFIVNGVVQGGVDQRLHALLAERALLERLLSEAHEHLAEVKTSWSSTIAALETQVARLAGQTAEEAIIKRKLEEENEVLQAEVKHLREDNKAGTTEKGDATEIKHLKQTIQELHSHQDKLQEEQQDLKSKFEACHVQLTGEMKLRETIEKERNSFLEKYEEESREKDKLMMRNAQISQETELMRQKLNSLHRDNSEENERLHESLKQITKEKDELQQRIFLINESALQSEIQEKNKIIKSLQQRITDMKKTLHRELKATDPGGGHFSEVLASSKAGSIQAQGPAILSNDHCEDINFAYLKHVLIKFLTSREYEAQQLTRAVATLLRFSAEEEKFLRETLQWKMSWFGTRPRLTEGIQSRSTPPR